MKNMLIVFFIVLFLISIIVYPFKIRTMGHFNFIELIGIYSLKIMFIKILTGRIKYENNKLVVENLANILEKDKDREFSKNLVNSLIKKIDIKKIELYFKAGFSDNSYSSALVCGSASSIIQTLYSIFSQKYYNVKLYEDIDPTFSQDNLEISFDAVISISLISLVTSMIISLIKKKESKNER